MWQSGVRHFVYTQSTGYPNLVPRAFPFSCGAPHEKGKAPGTRLRLRPHDTHSKGKNMSFTRKMFRTLTKRILTCIFKKSGRLFSILVQNSPKVTKKVLVFRKVAWSCSLTKKLLKILKVAKKLLSRIWKGLAECLFTRARDGVRLKRRPRRLQTVPTECYFFYLYLNFLVNFFSIVSWRSEHDGGR